jgi:hypothetical protein
LTDGICGDVFDVVEGIAGKTVIKLTQEEKGIRGKIWFIQENIVKMKSGKCDTLEN